MKAKLKSTNLNFDYYNKYDIKIDKLNSVEFSINANVYKIANDLDVYDIEIQDTEATFYLNGKATQYQGYKNLYNSLYGENSYIKHYDELDKIAIKQFEKDVNQTPLLKNISKSDAKKYIKKLLSNTKKCSTNITTIRDKDNDVDITYTDNWLVQKFAKIIDSKLVFKHMCKYTQNENTAEHFIANVTEFVK
jgi:hypothetical protein